jgi:poly(3-hydroxybutyrate) depolymerase
MSANLLGCYADVFAGAMLHSGVEFAAAQTEDEAHKVTKSGPTRPVDTVVAQALKCSPARTKPLSIIVVHGDKDSFVNPLNGSRTVELFTKINTAYFKAGGGTVDQVVATESRITQNGRKLAANVTEISFGGKASIKHIVVEGLGHAWSGGQPTAPYMEVRGVPVAKIMTEQFFTEKK